MDDLNDEWKKSKKLLIPCHNWKPLCFFLLFVLFIEIKNRMFHWKVQTNLVPSHDLHSDLYLNRGRHGTNVLWANKCVERWANSVENLWNQGIVMFHRKCHALHTMPLIYSWLVYSDASKCVWAVVNRAIGIIEQSNIRIIHGKNYRLSIWPKLWYGCRCGMEKFSYALIRFHRSSLFK